ncbi:MAG: response regulator [Phycisphaerales bacterium]
MKTTVLVVEDNDDLALMLQMLISSEDDMTCVGKLANANAVLETVEAQHPNVVLMDLGMPGRNPLEVMREATARFASTRFIILSGYDDQGRVNEVIDHGAWGFVSKNGELPAILAAIRRVARGEISLNR